MEYTVVRSKRKTLALQVHADDLHVTVRAPMRATKREIERFVKENADWVCAQQTRLEARLAAYPPLSEADLAALQLQAQACIPERVAYYARIMGLAPESVRITRAKTRFGSCSAKNRLNFSCRLMRYPPAAIDYVVVHELAHIVHKNHGAAFYALVGRILPDYKARQKLLKG